MGTSWQLNWPGDAERELADGVLPFLFPPEHYFGVMPLLEDGMQMCLSTPFYGIVWRRNNLIANEEGL